MNDCRSRLLGELAQGAVGDEGRREAWRRHAAGCSRCRELLPFLDDGPMDLLPDEPMDEGDADALLGAVLRQTIGSPCATAEQRLAEGLPSPADDPLHDHLEHCADCRRLAGALEGLAAELPNLQASDPGPAFTAAVLRRCGPGVADHPPAAFGSSPAAPVPLARRWWNRPRIAWELSYAATLLIGLVLGPLFGISPLRAVGDGLPQTARLVDGAARDWAVQAGGPPKQLWGEFQAGEWPHASTPARRAERAQESLRQHGDQLGGAVRELDFWQGSKAAGELLWEVGRLPQQLLGGESPDATTTSTESATRP